MAKTLDKFSHEAELENALKWLDDIQSRWAGLEPAIRPTRQSIEIRLEPSYPRITMREQRDIMFEVCLIIRADEDMSAFAGVPDVQNLILQRAAAIHPSFG